MSAPTRGDRGGRPRPPTLVGYPANFIVAGRRCVVVGAGRIAQRKIEGLLAAGADVEVVAPEAVDGVRALADAGTRPVVGAASSSPPTSTTPGSRSPRPSTPEVNRAVFVAGEARRVWVNAADDPANCSFSLMSVVRQGDIVVTIGTNGRSPALATFLKDHVATEMGTGVRDPPRAAQRGPGSDPVRRAFQRGRRLAAGLRFRHPRPDPCRPGGRSKGVAPLVSVIVVGLNHRTAPVELRERVAVPSSRLDKALHDLVVARAPRRGRAALHLQPHRDLRPLHEVPLRGLGRPRLPRRAGRRAARGVLRAPLHVLRRRRGEPPLRRGRRARLDDPRRGRDPRPGARRVAARRDRGRVGSGARAGVPPRDRGRQAGPHRDRDRPLGAVDLVGRGRAGRAHDVLAARPLDADPRRRRRRRGPRPGARRAPAPATSSWPTAPTPARSRWPRSSAAAPSRSASSPSPHPRRRAAHRDRLHRGPRRARRRRGGDGAARRRAAADRRRRRAA